MKVVTRIARKSNLREGARVKNVSTKTRIVLASALVLTMLLATFSTVQVSASGPVTANKLDGIYATAGMTEAALETGAIDLNDEPVSSTNILAWSGNPAITMDQYSALDKFQVDMNNQWWPTGPNDPTHASPGPRNTFFNPSGVRDVAALHFRRAVAHLVNKEMFTYKIETEVPRPALEGYTDYSTLVNATADADPWSPGMGGYIYAYDTAKVAQEFELGGFWDYDADTFREWRDPGPDGIYGTGDDGPIEELPNMKFYALNRGPWLQIAPSLYNEMLSAGIPAASSVDAIGLSYIMAEQGACYNAVAVTSNYNFFAGGSWALGADPDFIYNLYHSSMGQYSYALNYAGFKNAEFDSFALRVKYPPSLGDLRFAAVQAQWVKAKYVPVIELFSSVGVKAYRTGWDDVINMAGCGTDNRYSFLLMNWVDGPGASRSGPANTIVYGLSSGLSDLHVISSGASWSELPVPQKAWYKLFGAKVLSQIYDSLIGRNPYNLPSEVGWLASSWSLTSNYPGWEGLSVAQFTVRTDALFSDLTPVKPADVAYSLLMPRDAGPVVASNYIAVRDINSVEIQGQIVRVFFNTQSALALHWVGFLPIINKDLWDDAIGVGTPAGYTGFIPDDTDGVYIGGTFVTPNAVQGYRPWESTFAGNPAVNDLEEDGSGPWGFVSYTIGSNVALSGFTSYYTTIYYGGQALTFSDFVDLAFSQMGNVNYPGSYGESQGWYLADEKINFSDLMLIVRSMPSTSSSPWGLGNAQYNPDADVNDDGAVNIIDLVTAGVNFGKTMG